MAPPRLTAMLIARLLLATILLFLPCAHAQVRTASVQPAAETKVDAAFRNFWAAESPAEAARIADEIEKSGVPFDEALRRLKLGRTYSTQESGVIRLQNRTEDGVEHFFAVDVPPNYDPARRYQLRFQLHGGIGGRSDNQPRGTGDIGPLAGAEQIYVLPYAWDDEPWWSDDQVLNLNAIIDTLKRKYNIDENRVVLAGVSDGATGTYYIAMRDTTPFASFLPLNGFIMVLANGEIQDGLIFPNNLRNKPMFVINGGRDRLYPISIVEPYTRHLMGAGISIEYHPQPDGEHNTKWWPEMKDPFERFVAAHPRDPDPDTLTWEAADGSPNRAHWLVIDEFGSVPGESRELPDANVAIRSESAVFSATDGQLFTILKGAGRVDLVRKGNTVNVATKGVAAFTLLLSPDRFDFSQPIKVVANGHEVYNARVERSVKALVKWAARDNDRTMLYAAELHIKLPH